MSTITVLDSTGATQTVQAPNPNGQALAAASRPVVLASDQTLPLPTGAATSAKQPALGTAGIASTDVISVQGVAGGIAQNVNAATLPLPAGAATDTTLAAQSAKLPASLGAKAGAASLSTVAATDDYARLPASSCNVLLTAAATTNATSVKASAGALKSIQGYNAKAAAVFLKFYDKASAPTVGTDIPVKVLYVPATSAFVFDFPAAFKFVTGIAYAITGGSPNADTTALVSGDVLCLNVDYI